MENTCIVFLILQRKHMKYLVVYYKHVFCDNKCNVIY